MPGYREVASRSGVAASYRNTQAVLAAWGPGAKARSTHDPAPEFTTVGSALRPALVGSIARGRQQIVAMGRTSRRTARTTATCRVRAARSMHPRTPPLVVGVSCHVTFLKGSCLLSAGHACHCVHSSVDTRLAQALEH